MKRRPVVSRYSTILMFQWRISEMRTIDIFFSIKLKETGIKFEAHRTEQNKKIVIFIPTRS